MVHEISLSATRRSNYLSWKPHESDNDVLNFNRYLMSKSWKGDGLPLRFWQATGTGKREDAWRKTKGESCLFEGWSWSRARDHRNHRATAAISKFPAAELDPLFRRLPHVLSRGNLAEASISETDATCWDVNAGASNACSGKVIPSISKEHPQQEYWSHSRLSGSAPFLPTPLPPFFPPTYE